jgi:hypothetical protein
MTQPGTKAGSIAAARAWLAFDAKCRQVQGAEVKLGQS